jgi:hypothetical protein
MPVGCGRRPDGGRAQVITATRRRIPYDVRDHGFSLTTEIRRMIIRSIVPDHVASLISEQRKPPAKLRDHAHTHDHGLGAGGPA